MHGHSGDRCLDPLRAGLAALHLGGKRQAFAIEDQVARAQLNDLTTTQAGEDVDHEQRVVTQRGNQSCILPTA